MVKKGLAIVEENEGWQITLGEKESDLRVKEDKGKERKNKKGRGKKERREKVWKGRACV